MFVQFWFKFANKKHFKDQTILFALTFLQNLEISFDGLAILSVFVLYVTAGFWSLVFLFTLMKVSAGEANIVCIAQFHRKNEWRVDFIQRWEENRGWWGIEIQAEKAFEDNGFNRRYALNITKKTNKQKTPFPNLQEICTSKWIELPWALLRTTNGRCVYVPYWRKILKEKQDGCFLLALCR